MTTAENPAPLQFETAIRDGSNPDTEADGRAVTCRGCQQTPSDQYFDVNGEPACASCRDLLVENAEPPRGLMPLIRTAIFGVAAAIAGAVLYYAVIAITNFEIGLAAVAIGYLVGYAIRLATFGKGGRRFQIAALVLTYWSVGLAYTPLVFSGPDEELSAPAAGQGTGTAPATDPLPDPAPGVPSDGSTLTSALTIFLLYLLAFSFALPVMVVVGSLPSGLISAAIIGFGMHQAWRMTAAPHFVVTGPFRIGAAAPSTT